MTRANDIPSTLTSTTAVRALRMDERLLRRRMIIGWSLTALTALLFTVLATPVHAQSARKAVSKKRHLRSRATRWMKGLPAAASRHV